MLICCFDLNAAELVQHNMSGNEQTEGDFSCKSTLVNSDGEHNVSSIDAGTSVVPDLM